jgi:hypothetical protein
MAAVAPFENVRNGSGQHQLFGLTLATDIPFKIDLSPSRGPIVLSFFQSTEPHRLRLDSPPVYISPLRDRDGASLTTLYREPEGEILSFPRTADFFLDSERIDRYMPDQENDLAELRFLGPVMSYWFERRGHSTLHASAVALKGHSIAFVSHHGGGKSGLAAALIQAGASLLTDDMLVVEEVEERWQGRPSYPHLRMWQDEAEHFLGHSDDLPLVQRDSEKRSVAVGGAGGFGSFHDASVPLACIYLAARRPEGDGGVEIQPVSRSEALIELVRHSFSPRLVEAAGLQPSRLDRLSRLVRQVPVRRLSYPSGFERLPEVAEALLGSW